MNRSRKSLTMRSVCAAALLAVAAAPAMAQQNLEKLKQFKVATTDLNIPVVPQTGRNADAIRANLKNIKMPPGFKIDLYAVVPDARMMAVAPSTNMLFVGTRKTSVWAVTDRNSDGQADEVKSFAPSAPTASSTSRWASPTTCSRATWCRPSTRSASAASSA
jgi:hypothetical protein